MEEPAGLCQNNESGTPHRGAAFAFLRRHVWLSPQNAAGRLVEPVEPERHVFPANTDCEPASPLHVAMRAKPNVFFPSVFEGGGVRQSREGERNNGGRKKKKQVTSTAPGNDSADMTETTEGVFGRRIISLREKKRRQELIMSLIHLKCWLILITLLQRDYERLTDTKLELNC